MAIELVSSACSYDNVTVYDGENTEKLVGAFCGTIIPKPIISSGSVMVVRFATDKLVQETGKMISLRFYIFCDGFQESIEC